MAGTLLPVFEVPEFINESQQYDTKYKRSVKWNVETGDFERDGANRMVECDGKEAFMTWCYKVVQTERYACLAYPSSIGVEMENALAENDEKTDHDHGTGDDRAAVWLWKDWQRRHRAGWWIGRGNRHIEWIGRGYRYIK